MRQGYFANVCITNYMKLLLCILCDGCAIICHLDPEQTRSKPEKRGVSTMKSAVIWLTVFLTVVGVTSAQDKATVQTESSGAFHPGGQIIFKLKLNEPLPKGAHFDLRISPVSNDEEINLGSGEPVDEKQTEFRVKGTLPEGALPGDWHISVIWLFLPGSGWTHSQIAPNDLRFKVEGKPYPIPTKAEVTVAH
jgi:hypothetical protein